jgi:membrane-bound lytic murein transglycosylase D
MVTRQANGFGAMFNRYALRSGFCVLVCCLVIGGNVSPTKAHAAPAVPASPAAQPDKNSELFPAGTVIQAWSDFWRNVYASWHLNEVVLHDSQYPELIYEVLALPGTVGESLSVSQRDYVDTRRQELMHQLREIERYKYNPDALTPLQHDVLEHITTQAGAEAIIGAAERVRPQRGLRERFARGLEISGRYVPDFRRIFKEAGLPEDLAYLPHVESSFQATARSSAGAVGLWQFTRPTGKLYMKINTAVDERLDPFASARASAQYLRDAYATLGSWPLAVTSYNHGVAGMRRASELHGADIDRIVREYNGRYFGFASRNFYAEFLAARSLASRPHELWPDGLNFERPRSMEQLLLPRPAMVDTVAQHYGVDKALLTQLNPAWSPRAARGQLALPAGVRIWLPGGTLARAPKQALPPLQFAAAAPQGSRSAKSADTAANRTAKTDAPNTPPGDSSIHVVQRNETLSSIAARYGTSVTALKKLNNIRDKKSALKIGQRLRVPAVARG